MKIPWTGKLCEADWVNPERHCRDAWLVALMIAVAGFKSHAQSTNTPAAANGAPGDTPRAEAQAQGSDESAFHIVAERNIFNANRSGGTVRMPSQRPTRIEYFTLVGTMAYEKGVFAFFEGSNSELTKAMKANGVIAGHKLVDIYTNSVKIEADGKEIELPVGSQMRREDEGTWHATEASSSPGGSNYASNRNGDSSNRNSRSGRGGDSSSRSRRDGDSSRSRGENPSSAVQSPPNTSSSGADQAEVLKRLMERREKESQ